MDNTAEWIDINAEVVLVSVDVAVHRPKTSLSWPVNVFWASPKARAVCASMVGYKKGGIEGMELIHRP